jgi:hypothetical protein
MMVMFEGDAEQEDLRLQSEESKHSERKTNEKRLREQIRLKLFFNLNKSIRRQSDDYERMSRSRLFMWAKPLDEDG